MKNKICILILMILFITLAFLTINGYTKEVDDYVYNFIINIKCDFATYFMKFISFIFSTIMIVVYCVLGIFIFKKKKNSIFLCSIMAGEALINNIVKIIIKRARPNVLSLVTEKTYSFPSGHTMASIVLVLTLGYFLKQKYETKKNIINISQYLIVLLVGISRIYLGAHYFTDIIGAIILATIILLVIKEDKKISSWLKEEKI